MALIEAIAVPQPTSTVSPDEIGWLQEFSRREFRRARRKNWLLALQRLLTVMALLGIWQSFSELKIVSNYYISSPWLVGRELVYLFKGNLNFYTDLRVTCEEVIIGFVLGIAVGALGAVVLSQSKTLLTAMQPVIIALQSIPKLALAPMMVIWFGLGVTPKIFLAGIPLFFLVFFNVLGGIGSLEPALVQNLQVVGVSRSTIVRLVIIPSCAPWMISAMKAAISLSILGAAIGEFVGSQVGLGWLMEVAQNDIDVSFLFSVLVVFAAMGALLFALVSLLERFVMRHR